MKHSVLAAEEHRSNTSSAKDTFLLTQVQDVVTMVHPGKSSARAAPPHHHHHRLILLLLLLSRCQSDAFAFKSAAIAAAPRRVAGGGVSTKLDASKKGGMDAYAAQMAAMAAGNGISPATTAAAIASADRVASEMIEATRQRSAAAAATVPVGSYDDIEASTAIAKLEASQALSVARIASSIPDLSLKPDASYDTSSGFVVGDDCRVKLGASDAPGPANVAWLSDLCVDSRLSSLTAYNGPLTSVPHLISRCAVSVGDDGAAKRLNLFLDFRPRSYGAYEMRDPSTGNYPGPDTLGRKSFEYSGARKDYETKFGTEDVANFLLDVRSRLSGASDNPGLGDPGLSELETLTRGPLALDVTMPLRWVCCLDFALVFFLRSSLFNIFRPWRTPTDDVSFFVSAD